MTFTGPRRYNKTALLAISSWMNFASCRGEDSELFFESVHMMKAKKICRSCPVSAECLSFAFELGDELQGVWGGMTQKDRQNLRKVREQGDWK